ncbi:MAG: YjfB family protein [Zoogloea sp.]|jgi:hypothetical protein|nr:YjfB family protein [Zoogloea sp.]
MNIASVATTSQVQPQDTVSLVMLRKQLDLQQANAAQLIATLPQPATAPDPTATIGGRINTYA